MVLSARRVCMLLRCPYWSTAACLHGPANIMGHEVNDGPALWQCRVLESLQVDSTVVLNEIKARPSTASCAV